MQQFIQALNAKPFVQKLRTLEDRRLARVSTRRKQFKESVSKNLTALDESVKDSLKNTLRDHADDITYLLDALDDDISENIGE